MTKAEARIELQKKAEQGYLTHSLLLDLFKEDEDIPESFQEILWHKHQPTPAITIYLGKEGREQLTEAIKEQLKRHEPVSRENRQKQI